MTSEKEIASKSPEEKLSDELLKENNLWQIYLLSWKLKFPWFSAIFSLGFGVLVYYYSIEYISTVSQKNVIEKLLDISEIGFTFSSTLLGFLVAGFAVFSTVCDPKLLAAMAQIKNEEMNISWTKASFVAFMHIFSHFIAVVGITIIIKILYIMNTDFLSISIFPCFFKKFGYSLLSGLISAWIIYLLILVAQFVFNIYHTCMLVISVENEGLLK